MKTALSNGAGKTLRGVKLKIVNRRYTPRKVYDNPIEVGMTMKMISL